MLPFGQYVERGIVEEHGFSTPWWKDRPQHLFKVEPDLAPWAVLTEPFSVAEKGINEALVIRSAGKLDLALSQVELGTVADKTLTCN